MKLKAFLFIALLLGLWSCNNDDDNNGITPESRTYEFFENAEIAFMNNQGFETFSIDPGSKTVFKYVFNAEDNIEISDDEYSESVYFEVDSGLDNFSYTDSELPGLNMFIRRSCFCTSTGLVFLENGTLTGTKLTNGNWNISMTITFLWDEQSTVDSRTIEGVFTLQPIEN